MAITLKDIAKELNISQNTVSRALRDMPDIGSATTALVKETAARLGYQKNLAASRLRTNKSLLLGMVITDISNPVFASMIKGAEDTCLKTHYSLLFGNSNENKEEEHDIITNMLAHGIDGLLLVPSMKNETLLKKLSEENLPFVFLQRNFDDFEANCVRSDDYEGGYLAAKHLFSLGHRRFLYVAAPMHISSSTQRYDGFFAYLNEQGLSRDCISILECDGTRAGSAKAMHTWLAQFSGFSRIPATAIFCFSDYVAYGVYSALARHNLRIPEDFSVIGYDNTEYSDMTLPPLTTVDVRPYKIGEQAAALLLRQINRDKACPFPYESVILPELVIRKSTAPITASSETPAANTHSPL